MTSALRRSLSVGVVDVWFSFTNDNRLKAVQKEYEEMLSQSELEQYQQLKHVDNGWDYLVSRALLRTVLAEYCELSPQEIEFEVNGFGKPELDNSSVSPIIQFNTAHTSGLTVCVVTRDNAIGVDVECSAENPGILDVAEDYFSALELQALKSRDEAQQLDYFYRYWTLKEAYIKARGEGLSIPLHDFSVVLGNDGEFLEFFGPDAESWDFRLLGQNARYTAGLSMNGRIAGLNFFHSVPLGPQSEQNAADAFDQGLAPAGDRRRRIG
ncbi:MULTISPECIES: 4'-phosphopantetheinyl transferase family protein [Zhongshania]|jgi:4'-phosphopantetheinyl transferase|uniref:4'-phosphopantetheinyl transferase n=1 Tax=Zhongshania antarctica TaxID=641702 RepID=A0A840R7S1_9GAMM|nr:MULTISPECIES: 4'-phosphopantetheinyl transferase superfamily protein [Zhongshania]MBB5188513.1 4'-phosphopantetheinyl transferase [Zhongshania antarctica]